MMTQMRCLSTPMRFLFVFKLCQGTIRSRSAMSFIVPLSATSLLSTRTYLLQESNLVKSTFPSLILSLTTRIYFSRIDLLRETAHLLEIAFLLIPRGLVLLLPCHLNIGLEPQRMMRHTEVVHNCHVFLPEEARTLTAPVNVSSRRTEVGNTQAGRETEAMYS